MVNMPKEKSVDKESTFGLLENFMMGFGKMAIRKATEFGKESKATSTLASGRTTSRMGLESTHGEMEMCMKENGRLVSDMVRAAINLPLAMSTWVSTPGGRPKDTDNIHGEMATCTQENSSMDRSTDKASGKKVATNLLTNTKEDTNMTISMATANLSGAQEADTKATTRMT